MFDDLIPTIIQIFIQEKKYLTIEEIIEESSFGYVEVLKALNLLHDLGLVIKKEIKKESFSYFLIKDIKAIHLVKAAQLGVDLNSFSNHFNISEFEKKTALEIASNSEIIQNLDINKRKPLIQSRFYLNINKSNDVVLNLLLLLESSNQTLYDYLILKSKEDSKLKLLLEIHKQSENALKNYLN